SIVITALHINLECQSVREVPTREVNKIVPTGADGFCRDMLETRHVVLDKIGVVTTCRRPKHVSVAAERNTVRSLAREIRECRHICNESHGHDTAARARRQC